MSASSGSRFFQSGSILMFRVSGCWASMPCLARYSAHWVSFWMEIASCFARSFRLCHSPSMIAVKSFSQAIGFVLGVCGC